MNTCLNCNNEFLGNYCNQCGQKLITGRLKIKDIFSEFVQSIFYLDSPFLKTFILALHKPGKLAISYIKGCRKTYIKPIQFFLLFLTIYYIVLGYLGTALLEDVQSSVVPSKNIEQYDDIKVQVDAMNSFFQQNINLLYFGYVPFFALFTLAFFRKQKFSFAEILVFSLYTIAVDLLFTSIITVLIRFSDIFFLLRLPIVFVYFPVAVMQFAGKHSLGNYFKGILIYILTLVCYLIVTSIVLFIAFLLLF